MERFELENSREFKAAMELENALNDMYLGHDQGIHPLSQDDSKWLYV